MQPKIKPETVHFQKVRLFLNQPILFYLSHLYSDTLIYLLLRPCSLWVFQM